VEILPTRDGSLRVYACRAGSAASPVRPRIKELIAREVKTGLGAIEGYESFALQVKQIKWTLPIVLVSCTVA
jgi:C-methyltransferase-like protein